ncbi:hypothetical protein NPIL_335591 [Nephila pilipes]|uniref:Uncharacterized protein n=1 Tax=Nephila pilipes TaxID=299642 RepID=A0A8X6TUD8_NEPPI|nr:hypothetical protein NPIL_335591 [Nephila pilipes]
MPLLNVSSRPGKCCSEPSEENWSCRKGEKPHACDICGRRFAHKFSLQVQILPSRLHWQLYRLCHRNGKVSQIFIQISEFSFY